MTDLAKMLVTKRLFPEGFLLLPKGFSPTRFLLHVVVVTIFYEPRAGEGAKAKILTKMIYPRRSDEDVTAQSTVTLIAEKDININRKVQRCYTFYVEDDEICYAIKRHVHVFEEGDKTKIYDPTPSWS
jgi:hypothetical protein